MNNFGNDNFGVRVITVNPSVISCLKNVYVLLNFQDCKN